MAPVGFWPLIIFAAVSTLTPGGATTLATASGAHFGFRRSVPLMGGIAIGLASMAAAAAAGLAELLLTEPSLQVAMKTIGSGYLIWLAWKIGRAGPPHLQKDVAKPTSLLGGILLLWQNPKAWATSLGAAASFSALASGPVQLGILLGLTFGTAAAASLSVWCVTGQLLARLLRSARQWQILNGSLAALLVASIIPMWL